MNRSHRPSPRLTALISLLISRSPSSLCVAFSASRGPFAKGPAATPRPRQSQHVPSVVADPSMMTDAMMPSISMMLMPSMTPSMIPSMILSDDGGAAMSLGGGDGASLLAQGLGYLVGAGSFLLYTPIAVRIVRQKKADGLAVSTWWLKLASYTCTDVYNISRGYPFSTYVETVVITAEALVILILVSYFQKSMDLKLLASSLVFGLCAMLLFHAPPEIIALGQGSTALLNSGALVPQFMLNARMRKAGDYSPITAALASLGCAIRLFTTIQLTGSDPTLLGTFSLALLLNAGLLAQILWYGIFVEGRGAIAVLTADVGPSAPSEERGQLLLGSRDPSE